MSQLLSYSDIDKFGSNEISDEAYRSLLRALKRKRGFGLFFVVQPDKRQRAQLIEQLSKDLPHKSVKVLSLDRQSQTMYDRVVEISSEEKTDILVVQDMEESLLEYEDTKRLSGWSTKDIYFYKWRDVPPILNHLNQQRERFASDFPFCFVFVVRSFVLDYFIQRAPDFFDWRSGVFRMAEPHEDLSKRVSSLIEGDPDEYLSLDSGQRMDKILEIKDEITNNPDIPPERISQLLFEQGIIFFAEERLDKTFDCWDEAIKRFSGNTRVLLTYSSILMQLDRYERALELVEKALVADRNNSNVWNNHGVILGKLNRNEESLVSFDQAITLDPQVSTFWYNRGHALFELGRYNESLINYEEALGILSKATRLFPNKDSALWNNKAFICLTKGDTLRAKTCLNKALQVKQNDFYSLFNLGLIHIAKGKRSSALKLIKRNMSIDDDANCQRSLYRALTLIFLQEDGGLRFLKDTLEQETLAETDIKAGVLESAEIMANSPLHIPDIDQAVDMLKEALKSIRESLKELQKSC